MLKIIYIIRLCNLDRLNNNRLIYFLKVKILNKLFHFSIKINKRLLDRKFHIN